MTRALARTRFFERRKHPESQDGLAFDHVRDRELFPDRDAAFRFVPRKERRWSLVERWTYRASTQKTREILTSRSRDDTRTKLRSCCRSNANPRNRRTLHDASFFSFRSVFVFHPLQWEMKAAVSASGKKRLISITAPASMKKNTVETTGAVDKYTFK